VRRISGGAGEEILIYFQGRPLADIGVVDVEGEVLIAFDLSGD
jgi:hypothetical protein